MIPPHIPLQVANTKKIIVLPNEDINTKAHENEQGVNQEQEESYLCGCFSNMVKFA